MLAPFQDFQNPDNLKEFKTMMGNRSWNDFLGVLKDIHKVYQNTTNEVAVLEVHQQQQLQTTNETSRDECLTLKVLTDNT